MRKRNREPSFSPAGPRATVAILGTGLIGGALGMALREKGYRVVGLGRNGRKLLLAQRCGAIDRFTTDWRDGVKDADIVVVATPVDLIPGHVGTLAAFMKPGAVITDVGSVKGAVVKAVEKVLSRLPAGEAGRPAPGTVFVGGHPLAGSEKTGVEFAEPGMFRGATVVLTPGADTPPDAFRAVKKMWEDAGASVLVMDPSMHDRLVAMTSHLPHVLAFALSLAAGKRRRKNPSLARLAAGSFRDMTRVAGANPRDWAVICHANRKEIEQTLTAIIALLKGIRGRLKNRRSLEAFFRAGAAARRDILG